jgi:uncharacterized protein YkwD
VTPARSGSAPVPRAGVCHSRTGARRRVAQTRPEPRAPHLARRALAPARLAPGAASVQRSATIAGVLATACENTQLTPEPGNSALVRDAVLCLVNRERAQQGELPLALNPALQAAADGHAQEMISADYFEHVSPNGLTPLGRMRAAGYLPNPNAGYVVGENIAWGTLSLATPQSIVSAWIASPEHLANILEDHYRETGIGIAPAVPARLANGQQGATYAQEFGVVIP